METNENEIMELYDAYVDNLQNKKWYELTTEELQLIKDPKKRAEYNKKVRICLKGIKNRGKFKFSVENKSLTCEILVKELFSYYKKQGFDKQEIINIANEADSTKKY